MAHSITALGSALEWETADGQGARACQVDSTHWLVTYQGPSVDGFASIFTIDGSGNLTELGTPFEFDTAGPAQEMYPFPVLMDSDSAVVVYRSVDNDGFAQTLAINTGTWAVTSGGTAFEFDAADSLSQRAVKANASTLMVGYRGTGADGFAIALSWNSGTGALTAPGGALEFDTTNGVAPNILQINSDATRYLVVYQGAGDDGFARVLTLNTGTHAITATSVLEFDTVDGGQNETVQLDANHFLNTWWNVTSAIGKAQVLTVNLSTFAITAEGSATTIEAPSVDASGEYSASLVYLYADAGVHYVARAFRELVANGAAIRLQVLAVDGTTWAVTEEASVAAAPDDTRLPHLQKVSDDRVILWWTDNATNDGFAQAFDILPPSAGEDEEVDEADDIGITDTATVTRGLVLEVEDDVGITDTATASTEAIAEIEDLVGITDAVDLVFANVLEFTDPIGITDALAGALAKVITDVIGITDSIVVQVSGDVATTDNVGITEDVLLVIDKFLTNDTDIIGITDTVVVFVGLRVAVTDTIGIDDTVDTDEDVVGDTFNVCLTVGAPMFLPRSAFVILRTRTAAIDMVDREAGGPELHARAAAIDMVSREASVRFRSREAGDPAFRDRDATLAFQDHEADVVLDCEEV